jgi:protein-S-isoprenylcysteine O-methyltransferase Ste14
MLIPWHPSDFSPPLSLSLLEWSMFAFWWKAASKSSSPAIVSEPLRSRRFHVILFNIAFVLVVLPVRQLTPRFLPDVQSAIWLGLSIQSTFFALAILARRHLSSHWSGEITIKVNHELIQSGPYRLIRHPIYAGILGMFVGSTIASGEVSALFGLISVGLLYRRKVLLEETNLRRAFGSTYDSYRDHTGALLPKLRISGRSSNGKSASTYL